MNRLKEKIKKEGRTQKWFAVKMNKTENTISLWVQNRVQPSISDLYKAAEILEVEVAELLVERNKLKEVA